MMKKTKVIFFGTPVFVTPVLEALIVEENIEVVAVVTQPDRVVGRKKELEPSPVKRLAEIHNIPVWAPESSEFRIQNSEFGRKMQSLKFDLGIVAAYGEIIPKNILDMPKYGFLNIHPSLLPKFRGASPVAGAIFAGEKVTGVTIMQMTEKMDAGPIVAQWEAEVKPDDNAQVLRFRLFNQAAERLGEVIGFYCSSQSRTRNKNKSKRQSRLLDSPIEKEKNDRIARRITGFSPPLPQDETQATFTYRMTKEHGYFPWEAVTAAMKGESYEGGKLKLMEAFPFLTDVSFRPTHHLVKGEGERRNLGQVALNATKARSLDFVPTDVGTPLEMTGEVSIAPLLERAVRALYPWPGVFMEIELRIKNQELRKYRLKLLKGHLEETPLLFERRSPSNADNRVEKSMSQEENRHPELDSGSKDWIPDQVRNDDMQNREPEFSTSSNNNYRLVLDQVQLEGKKPVNWRQFVEGYPEVMKYF